MGADVWTSFLTVLSIYFISSTYLIATAAMAARKPRQVDGEAPLFFVLVIPALNEELVIGNTIRHLLSLHGDNYIVLVIDDASDDRTRAIAATFPANKVKTIARVQPFARKGKGEALNHAYRAILTSDLPVLHGEQNVILAVMDADGQVQPGMLQAVTPYFNDPRTAGVQVGVRMLNARENLLTRWQQFEFVTFNWLFSRARESIGSCSLGGNGQFVRLSALASLDEGPWSRSLTEDLDISLRLMLKGWRNRYCHEAEVYQQAVPTLRPLVRQRSRWYQGHLSCWKHVPRILASDWPAHRKADVVNYLLAPGLVIPMGLFSVVQAVLLLVTHSMTWQPHGSITDPKLWMTWYVLGLGGAPLFAVALWRSKQSSLPGAVFWAHVFVFGSYIWLIAGLVALKRMATGKAGWLKTRRTAVADAGAGGGEGERVTASPGRFSSAELCELSDQLTVLRASNFVSRAQTGTRPGSAARYDSLAESYRRLSVNLSLARAEVRLKAMTQHANQDHTALATAEV